MKVKQLELSSFNVPLLVISCGDASRISGQNFTKDGNVSYACKPGFTLSGNNNISCQTSRHWSYDGSASCEGISLTVVLCIK